MSEFPKEAFETIGCYVYRLIDPRNGKTFYVGKGQKNRVFDHIKGDLKFETDEDEISTKMQTIRDIHQEGKEVIHIIHRFGMTQSEALEVEAALIDVYDNSLTNIQSGYNPDRGIMNAEDLIRIFEVPEYEEPEGIDYIIIKTKNSTIEINGSLYEATRRAWKLKLDTANQYPYVISTIDGIVKEVYKVDRWYLSDINDPKSRIQFDGVVAPNNIRTLFINKKIPAKYRQKGSAYPALYKKK